MTISTTHQPSVMKDFMGAIEGAISTLVEKEGEKIKERIYKEINDAVDSAVCQVAINLFKEASFEYMKDHLVIRVSSPK